MQSKRVAFQVVFLAIIVSLSGCHQHIVIPMPANKGIDPGQYSIDQYTGDLNNYVTATTPGSVDLTAAKLARNTIAYGLMTQIEVVYGAYYRHLFGGKNFVAIAGDFVSLGLGSAGSIATNAATKTIFSALGTGVTGINLSIDKNYYSQQSFQVIGIAMQTRRDKLRAVIINNLNQDVASYPLTAAKRDLIAYLNSGSLAAGLQELQEEAGAATAADKTPKAVGPPVAPTNLSPNVGISTISLLWDPTPGATSYNVYSGSATGVTIASGKKLGSVSTNLYTDLSAATGVPTFYVVTAVNAAGESPISNQVSATPKTQMATPAAGIGPPTNLLVFGGDSQNKLSWTASDGAVSFNVYRQLTKGVVLLPANKIGGTVNNFTTDSTVTNGITYFYGVTAVDAAGNESVLSKEEFATPAVLTHGTPVMMFSPH
jgi:hypothetical protein